MAYSIPKGVQRGLEIDLSDQTYDGHDEGDRLVGGLGQLVDGQRGTDNFRTDIHGFGKGKMLCSLQMNVDNDIVHRTISLPLNFRYLCIFLIQIYYLICFHRIRMGWMAKWFIRHERQTSWNGFWIRFCAKFQFDCSAYQQFIFKGCCGESHKYFNIFFSLRNKIWRYLKYVYWLFQSKWWWSTSSESYLIRNMCLKKHQLCALKICLFSFCLLFAFRIFHIFFVAYFVHLENVDHFVGKKVYEKESFFM